MHIELCTIQFDLLSIGIGQLWVKKHNTLHLDELFISNVENITKHLLEKLTGQPASACICSINSRIFSSICSYYIVLVIIISNSDINDIQYSVYTLYLLLYIILHR